MAIGTFPGMLQEGDHAGRPAATAVGSGALYACSDHALIYQSDGATWSTWAALGGGAPAAHAASHENGGSDEIDVTGLVGAGGSGGGFDLVTESGASFANFTSESGTWASAGGVIQQTMAGAAHRRARYTAALPIGAGVVVECDVRLDTVGGGDNAAGIIIGHAGSNATGACAIVLESSADTIQWENSGIAATHTVAFTIATATWYTLLADARGRWVDVYVNGTYRGTGLNPASNGAAPYVGLITYDALASFRNLSIWTAQLPA